MTEDSLYMQWEALEQKRSRLWSEQMECIGQINKNWTSTKNPPLPLIDRSQLLAEHIHEVQHQIDLLFGRTKDK